MLNCIFVLFSPSQIVYSIDTDVPFEINSTTGVISSLVPLDRESIAEYPFNAIATDQGMVPMSTTIEVVVTITDENDEAPVFIPTLPDVVQIRETEEPIFEIGSVQATDADEPNTPNSQIRYSITGGSGEGVFNVNPETGNFTLIASLDFENTSSYDLYVTATDQGAVPLNTTLVVNIAVVDQNDNIPLFTRQTYEFMFAEANEVGASVGQVEARDLDLQEQTIGYAIMSGSPFLPFEIDLTSGVIFANASINREELVNYTSPQFTLTVVAFHQNEAEIITDITTVLIDILDVDEFGVVINSFELAPIVENTAVGTRIGSIDATDRDPTSMLVYILTVAQDLLRIEENGYIYINNVIDLESPSLRTSSCPPGTSPNTSCIPVVITVMDATNPGMTANSFRYLMVSDVDDEPPVLSRDLYTLNISEAVSVGYPLSNLDIEASDPDYNVDLMYSIAPDQGVTDFRIQQASGLITVARELDFESAQEYQFTIIVEDSQGNEDNATVVIYIIDVNDNNPEFDLPAYNTTIPENFPVNDVVIVVRATDADSTSNQELTYRIAGGNTNEAFRIDSELGVISLNNSLNRENIGYYTLTVVATDAGTSPLTGTTFVNVTISDVNDHPPQFLQTEYRGFIIETAELGDSVLDSSGQPLAITYNDPDEGATVSIMIFNQVPFSIDSTTGLVIVSGPLDFEETSSYRITLSIQDDLGLYGAPTRLLIELNATNDHAPEFDQPSYSVTIAENSREGEVILQVESTDRDGAEIITYEIVTDFIKGDILPADPSSGMLESSGYQLTNVTFPFQIDSATGELVLLRELDYEVAQEWSFSIVASDLGGLQATASVTITVMDFNDNAPRFAEHVFVITIPENFTASSIVPASTAITATDADSVNLLFILLSGGETLFAIDRNTGYLFVTGSLDVRRVYELQLLVSDGMNEDTAVARIQVMDFNDNAPIFSEDAYLADIPEFSPPGTSVLQVSAVDADVGLFSQISYSLVAGEDADVFYIDETSGQIITAAGANFDYNVRNEFQFQVEARDGADSPRTTRVNVRVILEDVNNNPPVFTDDPFVVNVPETAPIERSVFQITATDADVGSNAQIYYKLVTQNSSFTVDGETGIVRVVSALDFDDPNAPKIITLDIFANDSGNPPLNTTGTMVISITDENDNAPIFEAPLIQILIPENAEINNLAFVINATDLDSGVNGDVTYDVLSIMPEDCSTRFTINELSGVVILREQVDAEETRESCTLVVRAMDAGTPSLSTQTTYVVIVTDINEFPPAVDSTTLIAQIPENSPNGTFVLQVVATDEDLNGIIYRVLDGDIDFFDVTESGLITVAQDVVLDREYKTIYNLTLEIRDDGLPIMRTTVDVAIFLEDENDNSPVFVRSNFIQSVRENHTLTTPPFLFVLATDNDIDPNNRVRYMFVANDDNKTDYGLFGIDSVSGAIYLTNNLDYEQEPRVYHLQVEATDGTFTDEARVSIRVLESNDIAPMFITPPGTIPLAEDADDGTFVTQVEAIDMDQGVNSKITFTLDDPSGKFTIHPDTGVISVVGDGQFNFESNDREYAIRAIATDNAGMESSGDNTAETGSTFGHAPLVDPSDRPLTSTLSLIIQITDVNDNAPRFIENNYVVLIIEHEQLPLLVVTVQATDADEPGQNNSIVGYRIVGEGSDRFQIDAVRGEIRTIPPIDSETQDFYELQVQAYDLGEPEQVTNVTVTVSVVDTNDNRPLFTQRRYIGVVDENSDQGTSVITVTAIDADNIGATLNYTVLNGSRNDYFDVELQTGVIFTTSGELDRETMRDPILFNVQATDADGFIAVTEVLVSVADVNDEEPSFEQGIYSFNISENTPIGQVFGRVTAIDADTGPNAISEYFFENGRDLFDTVPLAGDLIVSSPLCFSDPLTQLYSLAYIAEDTGMDYFNDTTTVEVSVYKENNFAPQFVQPSYVSRVDEEAPAGTEILSELRTTDQDICSGPPVFEIVAGDSANTFDIEPTTGRIFLMRSLTTDDLTFTLTLRATDTNNNILPNLLSEVTLTVLIGQLLPISMVVSNGLTVPTISRFSTEEYQQDIWVADASVLTSSPEVTYILGDLKITASIPVQPAPPVSVSAVILEQIIYPDFPRVLVGIQVTGEGFEKASISPTDFTVLVGTESDTSGCTTMSPTGGCVAVIELPPSYFVQDNTFEVSYSADLGTGIIGSVQTVRANAFPLSTTLPWIRVELPNRLVYPGQEFDVTVSGRTDKQVDYFSISCEISDGLEFSELASYTNGFVVNYASNNGVFTLTGSNNNPPSAESTFNFDIVVSVSLDKDASVNVSSPLNFSCNVNSLTNRDGEAEIYNFPAIHLGPSVEGSCDIVLGTPNTVVSLFNYASSSTLINTAVLNGEMVSKTLAVQGILASGIVTTELDSLYCESMNERVLQVAEDCSRVYVNGNETEGSESVGVRVSASSLVDIVYFRVWYPSDVQLVLGEEELSPIANLFQEQCEPAYESTGIQVEGVFSSGDDSQVVYVTEFVANILQSSDSSVLMVENNQDSYAVRVRGVAAGSANVWFADVSGQIYQSSDIVISSSSVTIQGISLSLHSDLVPRPLTTVLPGVPSLQNTIVALVADFNHLDVQVDILAEAVLSNGRNFELSESYGLSFRSTDRDVIQIVNSDIIVRGTGMGQFLIAELDQTNCNVNITVSEYVEVVLNSIESIQLIITNTTLSLEPHYGILNIPSQTTYEVDLIHQDGMRVRVTNDDRLLLTAPDLPTIEGGVLSTADLNISHAGYHTVTALYSYGSSDYMASVDVEIIGIQSITLTAASYPTHSMSSEDLVLEKYNNTAIYQEAQLMVSAMLSNGGSIDISDIDSVAFSLDSSIASLNDRVVTPTTPGNLTVTVDLGELSDNIILTISDEIITATSIPSFSLPTTVDDLLQGTLGETFSSLVTVIFSDGVYLPNIVAYNRQLAMATVQFSASTDASVSVDEDTGEVTLLRNSLDDITINATLRNGVVVSVQFNADLTPVMGQVDVTGLLYGHTAGDNVSVVLYLNIGDQQLAALEVEIYFNSSDLQIDRVADSSLPTVIRGRDVPTSSILSTSYTDTAGMLRIGILVTESITTTTLPHIATVQFTALTSEVPYFYLIANTVVNSEMETIGSTTPKVSQTSVFNFDPSDINLSSSPPRCNAPPCSPEECMTIAAGPVPGDTNADCVFDFLDALFLQQVIAELALPENDINLTPSQLEAADPDRNGESNPSDVQFLINARLGIYPIVSDLVIRSVDSEFANCQLTINLTLHGYKGQVDDTNFVYLGIFHGNAEFQTQFDSTTFSSGDKLSTISLPVGAFGGWILPEYFGEGVYGLQTVPGLISQTDIGLVIIYGSLDPAGLPTQERTLLLRGTPTLPPAYSSLSTEFMPLSGQPSVSVQLNTFNPTQFFDNSFSAELCFNNFSPVFNPNLGSIIVTTQNEDVTGVLRVVSATDRDFPLPAGLIRFSLMNVNPPGVVDINSTSGEIYVVGRLDREESATIAGMVVATDQGPDVFTRRNVTLPLVIQLVDINDNQPLAEQSLYDIGVLEDVPLVDGMSQSVFDFTGNDRDATADNNGLSDTLTVLQDGVISTVFVAIPGPITRGTSGSIFTVSLHLIQSLDRETRDSYNLSVILQDNANFGPLTSTVEIRVRVLDANDLRPVFNSPTRIGIRENNILGTVLLEVVAVDNDIGPNALFNYTINSIFIADDMGAEGPNPESALEYFSIDPVTGILTATRVLDREGPHSFIVTLLAEEINIPGVIPASHTIWVMVCEENDNAPVFNQTSYNADISENSEQDTFVMQFTATDSDLGSFCDNPIDEDNANDNQFLYNILTDDAPFSIDESTGSISVNGTLDYESIANYTIVVQTTDFGVPPQSSTTNITIFVVDLNDNSPILSNTTYYNLAVENSFISTIVIDFISATDADSGDNAEIRYNLTGIGNEDFKINSNTGVIETVESLDRERQSQYFLTVTAFNPNNPDRSDTAQVIIDLIDINDTPPVFSSPMYRMDISENLPVGGLAIDVNATDSDENADRNIRYSLQEPHSLFAIDPVSGEIRTLGSLCTMEDMEYNLVVVAEDNPGAQLRFTTPVNVTLNVRDDNSNDPIFSRPEYAAVVPDGIESGMDILIVTASDEDICSPPFTYSIMMSEPINNRFVIDGATGMITTSAVLRSTDAETYFITVLATDSGTSNVRTGTAIVIVNVGETVPVDFTTSIGYKVNNPLKTAEDDDISTFQQDFINVFGSSVNFRAQFGDISQSADIEVEQLPASRANAVLLTPEVSYDSRVAKIALGITDMFGSSRVEDADVFMEIEFNAMNVTSYATTISTRAVVSINIPRQWFSFTASETRTVIVRYGVVGYAAVEQITTITLAPEPDYRTLCATSSTTLLVMQVPSYTVYNDQVISVPILAQRSSSYYMSSFSLTCQLETGLQFEEDAFAQTLWATRAELNDAKTEASLTANRIGAVLEEFEYEELVSLQIRVSDNSRPLSISCDLLGAVDSNGDFEQYTNVQVVNRDGCRPSSGTVNPAEDVIVGALHASRQTALINDAVLSGQQRSVFPTVLSVVMAAEPRFEGLLAQGTARGTIQCSSENDNIVKATSNCDEVFVDGSEFIGSRTVNIILSATSVQSGLSIGNNAFPVNLEFQVWYPDLPIAMSVLDATLSPVEGWVTDASGSCADAYQDTVVEAIATFRRNPQENGVRVKVEDLLSISSTASSVAIQGTTVIGVAPGATLVQARNPNNNNIIANSVDVTVNTDTLRPVEIDTSAASSFDISTPVSIPYLGGSPFQANIDSSLSYVSQSASLVSTVIFSDAIRRRITNEVMYSSLNSSVLSVSGNEVTVLAQPSENLIQATWRSACDGSIVLSRPVNLDIDLVVPVIRVTISETVLIHSSDPAAISGVVNVPTQSSVTVQLVYYKNGRELRSVDVTQDPMTRFMFSQDDILSIAPNVVDNTMTLTATASGVSDSINLTVGYQALEEASPITLYLGYSTSIDIETRHFPAFSGSENRSVSVLNRIGNTGVYQRALLIASLSVEFPEEAAVQDSYDITSSPSLTYSSNAAAAVSLTGVIMPQAVSTVSVTATFINANLADSYTVIVTGQRIPVNSVSASLSNGEAIIGTIGELVETTISASVGFADGTKLDEAFIPTGQVIPGLFVITNNNPDIFDIDPATNQLTILQYAPGPVSITFAANQDFTSTENLYFYTNLEPQTGELDVGTTNTRPISPVEQGETFYVPLRFNIDLSGTEISALEIGVSYSDDLVELIDISAGDFWTPDSRFESSLREFRGFVYLGGLVNDQPATSGIANIAQLSFRALSDASGLAAINARVIKLLDRSNPPQDIFNSLPISPAASVGVFVNSTEEEGTLPTLQVDEAMDALQPTVTPCSGGVSVDGIETGDVNGDCIFNLDDVLAFQDGGCASYPDVDADYDGRCDSQRDLLFLLRASFRIVRFVQSISVTSATNDDCFLTIDATLSGRGSPVANGAQTSLMIGLFHRNPGFQQEVDATTISLNFGNVISSGDYPSSSSGGFFEAAPQDTSSISYRTVLKTAIAREDVGLILVQARVDPYGTISSDNRAEVITRYNSIPSYFPEPVFSVIERPSVNIPFMFELGFNPLMLFNQTFSSLICINAGRPVFFPFTTEVEVFENITMGSFVAQVFANDSDAGPNAEVMYSFGNDSSSLPFDINATTGIVTLDLDSTLDRETTESYFASLNAVDRGVLSVLSGVGELVVTVLDINDNSPVFDQDPFQFSGIPEDAPMETFIGAVTVSDADIGVNAEITFSILEPTFRIDSQTGEIFLIAGLDFEAQMMYTLNVTASDGGTPSLSTNAIVIISIDPVNDNPPQCEPLQRLAMVPENEILDANFFYIEVLDADLGADHSVLNFILVEPSDEFGVRNVDDMTGALYTKIYNFDRLNVPSYNVTVMVSDVDGQNCSVSIEIVVAEPSRFLFEIAPSSNGFFSSPVRPRPEKDGFYREVSFFRNSYPQTNVSASNLRYSASALRSSQPIARIDGIIREDQVWFDKPIVSVAAQVRDESLGPYVDYSLVHLEINPTGMSSPIFVGSSCRGDPRSWTGICLAEVEVPSSWFDKYTTVNVVIVGGDIREELGSVTLRKLSLPANINENLVVELPSYSLYAGQEFDIWISAPSHLYVQALQFELSLPNGLSSAGNVDNDPNWRCSNVTANSNLRYACIRVDNQEEILSLLGTNLFFSIPVAIADGIAVANNMVSVTTLSLVTEFGSTISRAYPAQMYSMDGLTTTGSASLNLVETQARGIFAAVPTPEIINTTPLNGDFKTTDVSSFIIYNRANVDTEFGEENTDNINCAIVDSTTLVLNGNGCQVRTQLERVTCTGDFNVSVTHDPMGYVFQMPMRAWCVDAMSLELSATDTELNLVAPNPDCTDFYQEAKLSLYGYFVNGDQQGPLVNIADVPFVSSNATVAEINLNTVRGISPGDVTVSLQFFPEVSQAFTVTNEVVNVYRLFPTVFSSIDVEIEPSSFTVNSTLVVSAIINQNFDGINIIGDYTSFVYFTDGARYDVPSDMITIGTTDSQVISTSLATIGAGESMLFFSWTPQGCTTPQSTAEVPVRVSVPQPQQLIVQLYDNVISGSTRGVILPETPSNASVSVTVMLDDGSVIIPNSFTYTASDNLIVSNTNDGLAVIANTTFTSANGTVTIMFGDFVESIVIEVLDVIGIQSGLQSFPDPLSSPANSISLSRVANTNVQQQAMIVTKAILSNSERELLTNVEYKIGTGGVAVSPEGVVTPTGVSGSAVIEVTAGEFTVDDQLTVVLLDNSQSVINIQTLELQELSATQRRVIANLAFADNTLINDVIDFNSSLSSLLSFEVIPPHVATFNSASWILEIIDNHYDVVTLIASTESLVSTLNFTANLEPALGEIDLGQTDGIPQPPISSGEEFTVDVRANTGGKNIGALEVNVNYDNKVLELVSIEDAVCATMIERTNSPPGEALFAFLVTGEITEDVPTIARLVFRSTGASGVTSVVTNATVLADNSLAPFSSDAMSVSRLDVLVGSGIGDTRSIQARISSPPTFIDLVDVNGDGMFNILDSATILRRVESLGPYSGIEDANKDLSTTFADALFLSRVSTGLLPFLNYSKLRMPSPDTNCTLEIELNLLFNDNGPSRDNTFVFVILSYPNASDLIALSRSELGGSGVILDSTSVMFEANLQSPESSNFFLRLFTPLGDQFTNVGATYLVVSTDNSGQTSPERFVSFTRSNDVFITSEMLRPPQLSDISVVSQRDPNVVLDDVSIGMRGGFHPFNAFTNTRRSDYCSFDGTVFKVSVLERAPMGQMIGDIITVSVDLVASGFPTGNETYSIISEEVPFALDPTSGSLAVSGDLDFETRNEYIILIQGSAGDIPFGNATIIITVVDVNDFPPMFTNLDFIVSISEDRPPSDVLAIFNATATDEDSGRNGEFFFSLKDPPPQFIINNVTGSVYQIGVLDREVLPSYNLTLTVTDFGKPNVFSNILYLEIDILDINDNAPMFIDAPYTFFIPENFYINRTETFTESVTAVVDLDAGANGAVTLTLIPLDADSPFQLNGTGYIQVTGELDREVKDRYEFLINASDSGIPPLVTSTTLTIIVADINDNAPFFLPGNDIMISVEEDIQLGTVISTFTAIDNDTGDNSAITYSLQNPNVPFSIDPSTGELSINGTLNVGTVNNYTLEVIASDAGVSPESTSHTLFVSIIEGQIVDLNLGEDGFTFGSRVRSSTKSYTQRVGYLFSQEIGSPVSASAKLNTAATGTVDQLLIPNQGNIAEKFIGSVLNSEVKYSLKTVTVFMQALDTRDTIARPTVMRARVTASESLRGQGGPSVVEATCTTSEELGFCIAQAVLPDEWFARSETNIASDNVNVWINFDSDTSSGTSIGELVVEHSPVYAIDLTSAIIEPIAPSHDILPGKNFTIEVFVVSPLDREYDSVEARIVWDIDEQLIDLVDISFDTDLWSCGKCL